MSITDKLTKYFCRAEDMLLSAIPYLFMTRPKIISMVDGGLGSQMRQFALGYCVARRTKLPLYLEINFFRQNGCDITGKRNRNFLLLETFPEIKKRYHDKLVIRKQQALIRWKFSDKNLTQNTYDFNPELFRTRPRYIRKYYDNVMYFKGFEEELRSLFRFNLSLTQEEKQLCIQIQCSPNACTVHIRKGDFVGSCHDVCSDDYYLRAMNSIHQRFPNADFFIFSNDEDYARKLTESFPAKITIVKSRNEADPRVDLYMLTLAKHSVISNSNFSWFGAFLKSHQEGVTIMPSIWLRYTDGTVMDSTPFNISDWQQMEV